MRVSWCVLIILFGCCVAQPIEMTFAEFITRFNKTYINAEERAARQTIFLETLKRINLHNSDPTVTYQQKVTGWTDRTPQERTLPKLNIPPSVSDGSEVSLTAGLEVPSSIDWSQKGKVTDIKDQGQCGCCWAFAVAAAAESYIAIQTNKLTDLSAEYLLECSSSECKSCTSGCTYKPAMSLVADHGIPPDSAFPYTSGSGTVSHTSGICNASSRVTLPNNGKANKYSSISDAKMKQILSNGPAAVVFTVEDPFYQYKVGVYSCAYKYTGYDVNHAVLAIGYTSDGNYLIKNEWGKTDWGRDGYGTINHDYDCGMKLQVWQFSAGPIQFVSIVLLVVAALMIW